MPEPTRAASEPDTKAPAVARIHAALDQILDQIKARAADPNGEPFAPDEEKRIRAFCAGVKQIADDDRKEREP